MENRKLKFMLSALLMLILLTPTGCASPSNPITTAPQATTAQAPLPSATEPATETSVTETPATEMPATSEANGTPAASQAPGATAGLCANPFYPVQQGATWTYKSTGGPVGEYSFTDTITSVREDGFTLSTQIAGLTRAQEWTCTPEGLSALQLGGAPAAMLNSQNIQLSLDVKNANGVTFPSQINTGDQWQQSMDVEGDVKLMNQEGNAKGNAQMSFTALGNESVSVPAGTFDAMKVGVDVTLNTSVNYQGMTLPVSFTGKYIYWFAPGVGWVKAGGTGSVMGASFSETTELQSYNVQ